MIIDEKKFENLILEDVPMIMLRSREDRGGYLDKTKFGNRKKYQPVEVPSVHGGFKEVYCEEY